MDNAISKISGPPRHHVVSSPQLQPVPRAFLLFEFVFVRDDASKPPLAPLYRGPYRVILQRAKFFVLQISDKSDSDSVDRLKPVYSPVPVDPAVPPSQGRPWLVPPAASVPQDPVCLPKKKGCLFTLALAPATQLRWNPHGLFNVLHLSPLSSDFNFWEGVTVATTMTCLQLLTTKSYRVLSRMEPGCLVRDCYFLFLVLSRYFVYVFCICINM